MKYWGQRSFYKITGQIGSAIKVDQAILNRDKLMFAKVLVEVFLEQTYPSTIYFVNEEGNTVSQPVEYNMISFQ